MNHKQKAGEIHSLAWIPQSIHTAFFADCSFLETYPKKAKNNNEKPHDNNLHIFSAYI